MPRPNPTLFVLLEHTTDGVVAIGVYPTKGSADEAREKTGKKVAAGLGAGAGTRRNSEVVDSETYAPLCWYTIHPAPGHRVTIHRAVKRPGRGKTTGRFDTREELIERVERLYWGGGDMSQTAIGKSCGVSQGVVNSLLQNEIKERRRNK